MSDLSHLSDAQIMAMLQQQLAAPKDDNAMRGFGLGVTQAVDGLAREVGRIPVVGPALDRMGAAMGMPSTQQAIQGNRAARANNTAKGAQFAGNVVGSLPTAMLPGGVMAQGAAGGAMLSNADSMQDVAGDAVFGAAGARVAQGAMNAAGQMIAPRLEAGVRRLVDEGIPLTPGQAFGGAVRAIEDRVTGLPVIGDVVNRARDRGVEQFNRTIINKALRNVGAQLPKDVPVGRDAVAFAADKVSQTYQTLLPSLQVKADKPFQSALGRIMQQADNLPADGGRNFRALVGDDVLDALGKGGTLAGEGLKTLESKLSSVTARLRGSPDAYQKMVGDVTGEMLEELRNVVFRSNPAKAAELKAVNRAFAELIRVEKAAGAAGNATGVFTPKAYQAAVRASDATSRKAGFARGRALNQDLSDAAADILPNRTPDSGTAGRAAVAGLGGLAAGGGAAAFGNPGLLVGGALASIPYTAAGQKALGVMLRQPGPTRGMIGAGARRAGMASPFVVPPLLAYEQ